MKMFLLSLCFLILAGATPLEITDTYVQRFKASLKQLTDISQSYTYHQSDFVSENETNIINGKLLF